MWKKRAILPNEGIMSIQELAKFLKMNPDQLRAKLREKEIGVLELDNNNPAGWLLRLKDIHATIEEEI